MEPQIFVNELAAKYSEYASRISTEGKKVKILDVYFPGAEIPPIQKLHASIFAGWFRKGEPFDFELNP